MRLKIKKVIKLHRFEYELTPYGIKKAICDCSREDFPLLLTLMEADSKAHSEEAVSVRLEKLSEIKKLFESVKDDPLTIKELKINGNDLKKAGLTGIEVGNALEMLLDAVLKDKNMNEKDKLLGLLRKE